VIGIRTESPEDYSFIDELLRTVFPGGEEAGLVRALRDGGFLACALVAEAHGLLVGHIAFSTLPVESGETTLLATALAPMAVHPERQRKGIGAALLRRGLEVCREKRIPAVIVVGDPAYYGRFGFSVELAAPLESPFSGPYMQALELTPGSLTSLGPARLHYPPPFAAFS
jgi:putative acetyltransferase